MPTTTTVQIPAPEFDLHELVMLHWDGEQLPTRITVRRYDIDEECWLYGLAGYESMGLVYSSVLEPRD